MGGSGGGLLIFFSRPSFVARCEWKELRCTGRQAVVRGIEPHAAAPFHQQAGEGPGMVQTADFSPKGEKSQGLEKKKKKMCSVHLNRNKWEEEQTSRKTQVGS